MPEITILCPSQDPARYATRQMVLDIGEDITMQHLYDYLVKEKILIDDQPIKITVGATKQTQQQIQPKFSIKQCKALIAGDGVDVVVSMTYEPGKHNTHYHQKQKHDPWNKRQHTQAPTPTKPKIEQPKQPKHQTKKKPIDDSNIPKQVEAAHQSEMKKQVAAPQIQILPPVSQPPVSQPPVSQPPVKAAPTSLQTTEDQNNLQYRPQPLQISHDQGTNQQPKVGAVPVSNHEACCCSLM